MTDVVLGIDVGTSGARIAAVDAGSQLKALSQAAIPAPITDGLRSQQDPALWWQAVAQALDALDLTNLRVRALAVDGTSGTILPIAADGAAEGLASMYNDVAEAADLAVVVAVAPRETAALGATSPLARALLLSTRGTRILHQADWLSGRFSGRYDVTDESNALKSGYDPVARAWPRWIGFRLPRDVTIVAGTTDGCAAFLASGASEPGDGVTSLGTTLTLKLLSDRPVFAPQYGVYSHRIGDRWLAGGASNSGGNVLAKYFSGDDMARLTPLLDPDRSTSLDYYPLPKPGERFPVNDPALRPRLSPRPDDDRVFFQAMLEGIAAIEALGYRRLAELGASPLASIRSAGGGAGNTAWARIRLRMLGVPERPSLSEHAAVGTARLAWRGIGHAN
ncbi:MAG: carbohydrate kinase [Rhizobiales bacterium]|nr:carbohydrate kinase [Hyphomicrobiales bacterium]